MPLEPAPVQEAEDADREPGRGLITLRLGDTRFGVWIDEVLEVVPTPPISRLPVQAPEVAGVTSVRGEVVPVLDLGLRLLDVPARRPGRLILVRAPAEEAPLALLVDVVETLLEVTPSQLRDPPPQAEAALEAGYIEAVVNHEDGAITVLRLEAATAPPAQPVTEE